MSAWIKLWTEMLSDGKFNALPVHSQLTAVKLFLVAGLRESAELPPDSELAWTLHIGAQAFSRHVEPLIACGILTRNGGGLLHVTNFEKRQSRMSDADRQRVSRAKRGSGYYDVTKQSQHVTDSVTESDIERKKEREQKEQSRTEHNASAKHPAEVYQQAAERVCSGPSFKLIDEAGITNLDLWTLVVETYIQRGYNPSNVANMVAWYKTGIPPLGSKPNVRAGIRNDKAGPVPTEPIDPLIAEQLVR